MKKIKKIVALLLSFLITMCNASVYSLMAAENDFDSEKIWLDSNGDERKLERINIDSAADLVALSKNCHTDEWSRDKLVVLVKDIDLTNSGFETIPIFNGVFNGNNHTIAGFKYEGEGYVVGLFRHIGESGVVEDLKVRGNVATKDEQQCIGGLCGVNRGLISNCTFQGFVDGKTETGGIVGVNESTGTIYKCQTVGKITGFYYTGGIAGKNYGTIDSCSNTANVNDSTEWVTEDDKLGTSILQNITKNDNEVKIQSGVDTGGIVGYSKGVVISCTNGATIGYERTGYNIGGIAGRQSGLLTLCTNTGTIYGRKDVGGIVGQLEPFIELNETESVHRAVAKLHDLIEKTLDDMSDGKNVLKNDMDRLQSYSDGALDVSDSLGDNLKTYINENTDQINYAAERMEHILDLLPAIMDDLDDANDSLDDLNDTLSKLNKDLNVSDRLQNTEYNEAEHRRLSLDAGVGGNMTADDMNPSFGAVVTITVDENNGYQLSAISAKDANGVNVVLNDAGEGKYTFTMPTPNVVVSATFNYIGGFVAKSNEGGKITVVKDSVDKDKYKITVNANSGFTRPSSVNVGDRNVTLDSNGEAIVSRFTFPSNGVPIIIEGNFTGAPQDPATLPAPPQYAIVTSAGTGGVISTNTSEAQQGTTIYVVSTSASGYRLSKLIVDGQEVNYDQNAKRYEFVMPDHKVVITAKYEPILLSLTSNAGGFARFYGDGNKVTINVTPNSGYSISEAPRIVDKNGNAIAVGKSGAGTNNYEFILSSSNEPARANITFSKQNQQDAVDAALDDIQTNSDKLNSESKKMSDEVAAIRNITDGKTWEDLSTSQKNQVVNHVVNLLDYTTNSVSAASNIASDLATIANIYGPYIKDAANDASDDLDDATKITKDVFDALSGASDGLRGIVNYLNAQSDLKFSKINDELENNVDSFRDNLRGISNTIGDLSDHASDYSDIVNDDLKAVNDQLNVVFDLLVDRYSDIQNPDETDWFDDVSEEELEQSTTGRVDNCINRGSVRGDIDIGGVVGSMSIDEEDPEDNAAGDVDVELGGKYTTKCLIVDCTNQGFVTSKKNGAGGIVGYMNHGICINCKGLGLVESTDNDYVGGIAGQSLTTIKNCYSLATLSGHKNVGGIAGFAKNVSNCYSMPTIMNADGRKGAIAGQIATKENSAYEYDGTVEGNYYVSDDLYGVDDISYIGVAEPLTYEELLEIPDLPNDFLHLKVTFKVDDMYLGTQELAYGESLSKIKFPAIPTQDNQYGEWPDLSNSIMKGNIVVEGEYKDDLTVVESNDFTTIKDKNGEEQTKASVFVLGVFTSKAKLNVDKNSLEVDSSLVGKRKYVTYSVTLENASIVDGNTMQARLFNPYDKANVLQFKGGRWQKIPSKARGQYLQVEMQENQGQYCVVDASMDWLKIIFVITIAGILAIAVLIVIKKNKVLKK